MTALQPEQAPRLLVVMGVSGAGKSTVGEALAVRLGLPYADADAFHPAANVAKMRAGVPLDDDDRAPWLAAIGAWLAGRREGAVVSCSALRRAYRDTLREYGGSLVFVHLDGSAAVVTRRVAQREGHFMPASLVASQLATLEPLASDEAGLAVPLDWPVERLVDHVAGAVRPHSTDNTVTLGAVS
jgi:gluconokinase